MPKKILSTAINGSRKCSLCLMLTSCLLLLLVGVANGSQVDSRDLFNLRNQPRTRSLDSFGLEGKRCGYDSCPETDPNLLNVHIVAHSHDDVGWLKTVDQYYYGTRKRYAAVGVQHILDSVVPQLVMDETKRFIYVEMSFFSKWWNEQDEQMKHIIRRLVNEGRLEFINGGWCMNDEATVSYQSTIEQMTLGLKFLNETFGTCARPKVGWQIDPFGHTNEQASLFAQFGFDGMFFMRISYRDKFARINNKTLDLIWHGDRILSGQSGSIFSNIFRDTYDSPNEFCFDVMCYDDNLVDNKKSYEYNMDRKGKNFIAYLKRFAEGKALKNILIPMGGDFQYSAAGQNFKNLDKLIKYIRSAAPDINIFYSTPTCYQWAVHREVESKSMRLAEKYDDFMPYESLDSVWWSGYFSSRPSVKLVERETANLLQVARMISFANLLKPTSTKRWAEELRDHDNKCLLPLWEILGDLQHHDAVTGTEKQHVADDYIRRAHDALTLCSKFIGDMRRMKLVENLKKSPKYEQLARDASSPQKRFKLDPVFLESTMSCPLLNISECDALESEVDLRHYLSNKTGPALDGHALTRYTSGQKFVDMPSELATKSVLVNVYNPLTKPMLQVDIRLPCNGRCDLDSVRVVHLSTNETMKLIRLPVPSGVQTLPFRNAITNYEMLFYANVPALGYTSFIIEDTNSEEIVDDEEEPTDSIVINDQADRRGPVRSRRIRRGDDTMSGQKVDGSSSSNLEPKSGFEYFMIGDPDSITDNQSRRRNRRQSSLSQGPNAADRIVVKFDLSSGMIVGLRRTSDGSLLNVTQKFGYYFPASSGHQPGAYIFRPNTSEPFLLDQPIMYKMYKRKNGSLIEIHQKWADWLWQTIRVDAKKNYIEFDYVVGPIPIVGDELGREVVTRYISNMSHHGAFFTDSNGRQLLSRHRARTKEPTQLGGSFYPVVSTIMLKNIANTTKRNSADLLAVLVDRAQAGTSLNEGQLELLIHRRLMRDDDYGVGEALNEPGEDGRGLVTRGKHRLYLKFPELPETSRSAEGEEASFRPRPKLFKLAESPKASLEFEAYVARAKNNITAHSRSTFIAYDQIYNELRQEARKFAFTPTLTFDRLRVTVTDFISMLSSDANTKVKADFSLLNTSLPNNINLLTLQPWPRHPNEILIRLENMDNPITIHPYPDHETYNSLLRHYKATGEYFERDADDDWDSRLRPITQVDIEHLIKKVKIVSLEEMILGANAKLTEVARLNWTGEPDDRDLDTEVKPRSISLAPRQIRTFLARYELI